MMLLSTPKGGVARAALQVIAPAAQTTRAPATIRFNVLRLMICPPTVCVRVKMLPPGAQTERRGDAGPVRSWLGSKASSVRFLPHVSQRCEFGDLLRVVASAPACPSNYFNGRVSSHLDRT